MILLELVFLLFVALPLEFLNNLPSIIFGFGYPQYQSMAYAKHDWKLLWGIKPVEVELTCVNGYLYKKVTYDDDTTVLLR